MTQISTISQKISNSIINNIDINIPFNISSDFDYNLIDIIELVSEYLIGSIIDDFHIIKYNQKSIYIESCVAMINGSFSNPYYKISII
jgi:hypothetical protein